MSEPLIFISHKHSDKIIAEAVGKFIESEAPRPLRIFLSSSPGFEGVRFGKPISGDLRSALAKSDVFFLIYTSADEDWSWCMWEWGVANHPASEKTTMVVLQCGAESPRIDTGNRRVNVRKPDEIQALINQYFKSGTFFPSLGGEPLAGHFTEQIIAEKADKLFNKFKDFPSIDPSVEWTTWPFLQLEMPMQTADKIKNLLAPLSFEEQVKLVKASTKVRMADPKALGLFGLAGGLAPETPFSNLALIWKSAFPAVDAVWFENCCEQIAVAAADKLPEIRPVYLAEVSGGSTYVPIITKVRRTSYQSVVRFDLFFLQLPTSDSQSISTKMLRRDQFYWKPITPNMLKETKLTMLTEELKAQGRNRLPLLDEKRRIRHIIHRASIDEFIVARLSEASALTLADLLDDPVMRSVFDTTFVVLGRNATLDQARTAMSGTIRDVFVTATGSPDEEVEGWITNVDLGSETQRR